MFCQADEFPSVGILKSHRPAKGSFFFKKVYLYLERGGRGKRERNRNISMWFPPMHP